MTTSYPSMGTDTKGRVGWTGRIVPALVVVAICAVSMIATAGESRAASATATSQDSGGDVIVTALHAIPGEHDFPADVYIDGQLAIAGFTKMMRTDPFTVPAGDLSITIYVAGADPAASEPTLDQTLTLEAGTNLALVAKLDDAGMPILAVYENETDLIDAGNARLVFRQTASGGPVDVIADGETLFSNVKNLEEVAKDLPAGAVKIDIVDRSTDEVLLTTDVDVREGVLTAIYAVDTTSGEGLQLAVQTVEGLAAQPSGVPTGSGGLKSPIRPVDDATSPVSVMITGLSLLGLATLLAGRRLSPGARRTTTPS